MRPHVNSQHILHRRYEGAIRLRRDDPALFAVGLDNVFPDYALASASGPDRTEHEHIAFAGVLRWRAIRSSSRKASARPVSPRFTEPKSNVMRRSSIGAGQTGSNVLGATAQITASSRAVRG